jgi:hypothetical protein
MNVAAAEGEAGLAREDKSLRMLDERGRLDRSVYAPMLVLLAAGDQAILRVSVPGKVGRVGTGKLGTESVPINGILLPDGSGLIAGIADE